MATLFLLQFLAICSFAASSDCTESNSNVERTICNDDELSKLDDNLNSIYQSLLSDNKLRNEQRQWIAKRNSCPDRRCIIAAYYQRISELQGYQSKGLDEGGPISFVDINCDSKNDILIIREFSSDSEEGKKLVGKLAEFQTTTRNVFDTNDFINLRGYDNDGLAILELTNKQIKRVCRIGKDNYHIEINGWKYNLNTNGYCGAAPPTIQLTVFTKDKKLLDKLIFNPCGEAVVSSVKINGRNIIFDTSNVVGGELETRVFSLRGNTPIDRNSIIETEPSK